MFIVLGILAALVVGYFIYVIRTDSHIASGASPSFGNRPNKAY